MAKSVSSCMQYFTTSKGNTYFEVSENTNRPAMSYIFRSIRGNIPLLKFAKSADIDPRSYMMVVGNEYKGRHPSSTVINKLIDSLPVNSKFTEEEIMAANGYIPNDYLQDLLAKQQLTSVKKSAQKTRPCFVRESDKHIKETMDKKKIDSKVTNMLDYIKKVLDENDKRDKQIKAVNDFIDKLSILSLFLSDEEKRFVRLDIHLLQESKSFNKILDEFYETFTLEEIESLKMIREYLLNGVPNAIPCLPRKTEELVDMIRLIIGSV